MGKPLHASDAKVIDLIKTLGLNPVGLCGVKLLIESEQLVMIEALYEMQSPDMDGLIYQLKKYRLHEVIDDPRRQGQG